ncbi:MAG: mycothiol synthase [Acidimicrobiales bacterium]
MAPSSSSSSPSSPIPDHRRIPGVSGGSITVLEPVDAAWAGRAQQLMDRSLPPEQRDERFDAWPDPSPDLPAARGAVATDGADRVIGWLVGGPDRTRLRLDALVDPAPGGSPAAGAAVLGALVAAVEPLVHASGSTEVEVWGRPAASWFGTVLGEVGYKPIRALHQMRCRLPVTVDPLPTRAFDPRRDLEALRTVNNRAFATHPDQGAKTTDELAAIMAEPWFRPDGVRLYEQDGRVVGFCWTRIHPAVPGRNPALGEIYVIGIDPDHHGQGLGVPMTAAGLAWLSDQGLEHGMLYVEADNVPAIRTYERLGFSVVRTDRAWSRPVTPGGSPRHREDR